MQLGILGYPLSHSLSPVIHRAFLSASGIDGDYIKLECREASEGLQKALALSLRGFNVTIPHKVAMLNLVDVDESARLVGAVNTVLVEDGLCTGYNTDLSGLEKVLAAYVTAGGALVIGAGGAARAALVALRSRGFENCTVLARRTDAAREMLEALAGSGLDREWIARSRVISTGDLNTFDYSKIKVVLNCAPLGQGANPLPDWICPMLGRLDNDCAAIDLVYRRDGNTPFCLAARDLGLTRVEDGLGMLVEQARSAFAIWSGREVAAAVAYEALA